MILCDFTQLQVPILDQTPHSAHRANDQTTNPTHRAPREGDMPPGMEPKVGILASLFIPQGVFLWYPLFGMVLKGNHHALVGEPRIFRQPQKDKTSLHGQTPSQLGPCAELGNPALVLADPSVQHCSGQKTHTSTTDHVELARVRFWARSSRDCSFEHPLTTPMAFKPSNCLKMGTGCMVSFSVAQRPREHKVTWTKYGPNHQTVERSIRSGQVSLSRKCDWCSKYLTWVVANRSRLRIPIFNPCLPLTSAKSPTKSLLMLDPGPYVATIKT